mgnify:CR=1 FL=1
MQTLGKNQRRPGFKPIDIGTSGEHCRLKRFIDIGELRDS